jgi:ABC-2 type transport system permease protein
MMLPLETVPEWMQALSMLNPLTYIVEAERMLFAGHFGSEVLWGFVAAAPTAAVGCSWACGR